LAKVFSIFYILNMWDKIAPQLWMHLVKKKKKTVDAVATLHLAIAIAHHHLLGQCLVHT
jgi:hypothetical protein